MIKNLLLPLFLIIWILPVIAGDDLYPFASTIQKNQFSKLTQEVRCLVCQNQAISDSNAPFAADLRSEIYRLIIQDKTDEEIKQHLTQRYGEYVLLEPSVAKQTWILWASPIMLLMVGMIVLSSTVRKNK